MFRDYTLNLQTPRREEDPRARSTNHQHSNRSASMVSTRTDQGSFQTRSASRRNVSKRLSLSHEFLWKTARVLPLISDPYSAPIYQVYIGSKNRLPKIREPFLIHVG